MNYLCRFKRLRIYLTQKVLCSLLVILVLCFTGVQSSFAQPQPTNLSNQEELNRRTRQEAEERRNRAQSQDTFLQPKVEQADDLALPIEDLSFTIHTLELQGEKVDQFAWVQHMLQQYAGQKIGKEGINILVKRLTNALISRGYTTTRIGIPEQDLSTGTLKLTLIPGIIRDIRFSSPSTRANWVTAFPTQPGNILNLRDLEQGLEQIKRVPSQDAQMQISPGEKPGESDVIIYITSSIPFRMAFSLDDSGTESTGRIQASTSMSFDNLLGMNDLFYISFNKDAEGKKPYGTRGNNYQYSFPYGYWTFTLAGSSYDYHQTVQNTNQATIFSGSSDSTEFRIQRLIHRDQQSKTSLQFRIIKQHSRNYIEDTELLSQRKNVTADEVSLIHRQYYGKTLVDVDLAHRWGVPWFHAQAEPENPEPDAQTTRYKLWTLDAALTTPMQVGSLKGKYSCNIRVQTTKDLLYNADYFSIGNRYTVRGFDGEQSLSAEKGWFIRNEISAPIASEKEVYVGLDYGQVSGSGTQWLLGKELAGAALGIRGKEAGIYYDIFTSWPVYKPKGYQTSPYSLGFQLSYQI